VTSGAEPVPPEAFWVTTTPAGDAVYFALPAETFERA
jgi:hypothetical protein